MALLDLSSDDEEEEKELEPAFSVSHFSVQNYLLGSVDSGDDKVVASLQSLLFYCAISLSVRVFLDKDHG